MRSVLRATPIAVLAFTLLAACGNENPDPQPDATDTIDDPGDTVEDTGSDPDPEVVPETECAVDGDCDDLDHCTTDSCDDEGECGHESVDADGDGHFAASVDGTECGGSDCDDADDAVYLGAPPGCGDGDDLNCNGVDDRDDDADGYVSEGCGGDDCDDGDEDVFPGSTLIGCTDLDVDCNGEPDRDNDGDGDDREECGGDDCDDENASVSSLVDEEDCDGHDTDCDGSYSTMEDHDRDGSMNGTCGPTGVEPDCDDDDPARFPTSAEVCDEVDNDCDGSWADGGADDDLDGVLDEACGGTDCDDTRDDAFPGSWEICGDGVDQDCDTVADDTGTLMDDVRVTDHLGSSIYPTAAWTGSQAGITFIDDRGAEYEVYFALMSGDGTKLTSDVALTDDDGVYSGYNSWASIVWTGSEFGAAWKDMRDGTWEVYFTRISASGVEQGSEIQVTSSSISGGDPVLSWTGSEYLMLRSEAIGGVACNYRRRLSPLGVETAPAACVSDTGEAGSAFKLARTASGYGMVCTSNRGGSYEVWYTPLSAVGDKLGTDVQITDDPANSHAASLVWTGSELGLAWSDRRDAGAEVYFSRLDETGARLTSDIRVTDDPEDSYGASMVWTGSAYGLTWYDLRDGNREIYFAALSGEGVKLTSDVRITHDPTALGFESSDPVMVWTGSTFAVTWRDRRDSDTEIYFNLIQLCY